MSYLRISMSLTLIILSALALGACVGSSSSSTGALPKGWIAAGDHPEQYEMSVNPAIKHGGKAGAQIRFIGETAKGFGTLMQVFKADDYRGKRVRMSAWIKSENADSAQLWMRLDGANSTLGFDNMDNRAVKGTTDWKKYEVTLDVPEPAVNIALGAFVSGKGQAWVDDFVLEVVGQDVSLTNMLTPEQMKEERAMGSSREVHMKPQNLGFEE